MALKTLKDIQLDPQVEKQIWIMKYFPAIILAKIEKLDNNSVGKVMGRHSFIAGGNAKGPPLWRRIVII